MAPVSDAVDDAALGLFPGQGSISSGIGAPWRDAPAWKMVDEISGLSDVDVARLLLDTPDELLVRTDNAQLATFALSLVGWTAFGASRSPPRRLAGHSLGEITALVAAGVVTLADGVRLVTTRGRAMADASARHPGSMVALMGPSDGAVDALASFPDVWIANDNGPGQVVVSGSVAALEDLVARSREIGWRRATMLPVGGAFHSPLMANAQERLDEVLATTTFSSTPHLVASNVDGAWHGGGDEWRARLSTQMTAPVRFREMIESAGDADVVVEFPPAGVLLGLVKRIRTYDSQLAITTPEATS